VGLVYWFIETSPYVTWAGEVRDQPVPFSHEHHVGGLGIDCRYCHTSVEDSGFAGLPPTKTCMTCHSVIWTNADILEPVRKSWRDGEPLVWQRVHNLPGYVYFNHSAHINSGVSCVSCHGRVDQMMEVRQVKALNMNFCLDCHRNPAPNLRPVEFVTKLDWTPPNGEDPAEIGRRIIAEKHINPPVNCSGCHR